MRTKIVPGHDNGMAIEIIVTHVKKMLQERSVRFRERMARSESLITHGLDAHGKDIFDGMSILPVTPQLKVRASTGLLILPLGLYQISPREFIPS